MRLVLDHHYSPVIAERLRERGFDATCAQDHDWQMLDDEPLLAECAQIRAVLLTNNVADFMRIVRRWQVEGRSHHGLVLTSDVSMPRTRKTIGLYVDTLAALMRRCPGDDDFVDCIHWLDQPS